MNKIDENARGAGVDNDEIPGRRVATLGFRHYGYSACGYRQRSGNIRVKEAVCSS
jgi:hypothetical protein